MFQHSPGPRTLKKEYTMPSAIASVSKEVSQSLPQVNKKKVLPTEPTFDHS